MNSTAQINAEEHKYWNSDSADYWVSQKTTLDQFLEPWTRLLVGAAQLFGGEQIADIGCGTGATTLKFAASVGREGRVTGIDLSRKLIDSAISSARERAIENVMFVEADAAEYRFPCPQDLIVSRCGVMFFGDLVAAFSHLRSGLARSGRILLVVWRAPEQNEWYQFPVRCAAAFSDQEPKYDPDVPGAFTLADPSKVKQILVSAGFRNIQLRAVTEKLCVGQTVKSAAELFMAMGTIRNLLDRADVELLDQVKCHMSQGLEAYRQESGVYMNGTCWLVHASA